jgi:hypothetical protein
LRGPPGCQPHVESLEGPFLSGPPQTPVPTSSIWGGGSLGSALAVTPAPAATIDRLGTALNNLAIAAANNTTVLQQQMVSNFALSSMVTMLTMANKNLGRRLPKQSQPAPRRQRRELLGQCDPPTCLSQATTVGPMAIDAASITQAQLVATMPWVTRTMQLLPTRWLEAKPTRVGTLALDNVGWQM